MTGNNRRSRIGTLRFTWVGVLPLTIGYASAVVESVVVGWRGALTWSAVGVTLAALVLASGRRGRVSVVAGLFIVTIAINEVLVSPTMVAVVVLAYVWLFEVAVNRPQREAIWTAVAIGGALCTAQAVSERLVPAALTLVVNALWVAVVTAVGSAIQAHRLYVASVEDRAARAERTKEEAVLRHVAEERMRIARELHDVVAHHITAVSMQIGVARSRLHNAVPEADAVLDQAQLSARSVISELHDIVLILRENNTDDADPPVVTGRLNDELADLLRPFESLSRPPTLTVTGAFDGELTPAVGLAVYRVVQESLTNAYKHGAGGADVRVQCGPGADATVSICNPLDPAVVTTGSAGQPAPGGGFGLVGMRERVRSAGGTFAIEESDEQFCVRAEFRRRHDIGPDRATGGDAT
ncbi:sensor histidine kinase [Gordonia lacunae]|uniref:histidine kinase n=1 Tax=Gordonia lacunae TaxID=417102 RepID=A0A243QFL9_9ACTN|nr:histidine kinase [Gordonia lacunae]OUC80559.1 hypothetical protein CA982_02155 [Gordonia lacunae]